MHPTLADLTDAQLDERIRYTAPDHPSAEPLRVERARRSLVKAQEMAKVIERFLLPTATEHMGIEEAGRWLTVGYLLNADHLVWATIALLCFQAPPSDNERQMAIDLVAAGVTS